MATRETRSAIADAARLYEADFYEWCITTATLLRDGRIDEVDLGHVAEEIEDLGRSQRHALDSRATVIIQHLLKLRYQPQMRTPSWDQTIITQRVAVRALLRNNPSLRRFLLKVADVVYDDAVDLAAGETGIPRETFPSSCPFTPQEVFGDDLIRVK